MRHHLDLFTSRTHSWPTENLGHGGMGLDLRRARLSPGGRSSVVLSLGRVGFVGLCLGMWDWICARGYHVLINWWIFQAQMHCLKISCTSRNHFNWFGKSSFLHFFTEMATMRRLFGKKLIIRKIVP